MPMIKIDPRKPPSKEQDSNILGVLILLKLETKDKPLYLVIDDLTLRNKDISFSELQEKEGYLFEDYYYSEDILRVAMVSYGGRVRTRGVFKFVEAIWLTDEYESLDPLDQWEYLFEVFPQLRKADED